MSNIVASVQYPTGTLPSGRYYQCVTGGTSSVGGTGPQGSGFNIVDGSVVWNEVQNPGGIDSNSGFINWLTMTIGKHNVHGIFGAKHLLDGDLTAALDLFYKRLTISGETYFDAYIGALSAATRKQPWAVIIEPHYKIDRFKEVQQDGYQGHVLLRSPY